ncbi:hypothetical protein M440DRAFT_1419217 [Trichoderma longibrachiatum ATCC 18648]|uniref:Uncharacterized protein n=1 Tax=Trichoderma longibrachiatum ATCC 18648 TaxID=983965 RepID=A0A2T4CGI0_TRILO|nr:hypothetical protein M440DRAFT_1419217 [Trichoderma longibrachiatum ATCC 18648]
MKPSSILLLAAAGLSSAMPAKPFHKDTRSLFGHHAVGARALVPLNANTAAPPPPPAVDPAVMQEIPTPTDQKADDAAAATTTAVVATEAAATTTAVATEAATTTAAATEAATATEAVTTTAPPPALDTGAAAIGNGTAGDNGKGKGKGNGKGKDNGKGNGNDKGNGRGKGNGNKGNKGNNNNNNNGGLGDFISGALSQLGLDGVLNAGAIDKLSAGDQISLLAQIVSLQTMKDLQMVDGKKIAVVLNQGFKSAGLNVAINA